MLKAYSINPVLNMVTGEWTNEGIVWLDDSQEMKFDRGLKSASTTAATTAGNTATQEQSNANQINSTLMPYEEQQLEHPTGYSPEQLNDMLVGSQQGAGGADSGITGEANLESARTRNTSGFSNALDKAARTKEQNLSENTLGIQNQNSQLEQQKQEQAAGSLQGLEGTDTNAMLSSMGIQNEDINSAIQADKTGWVQNMDSTISALGDAAKGAGAMGVKV